ncbi:MAG: hypothetical protein ACRCYV_03660 [Aeromonas sp.]
MQIIPLGQGPYHDFAITGTAVTLDDLSIDAQTEQTDGEHIISVYATADGMRRHGPGAFVATLAIPPRQWPAPESVATPLPDESPVAVLPLPLNADAVTLTLWPK